MKQKVKSSRQPLSENIQIDSKKCKACWMCIEVCPNNVLGKINILWHKHAKIVNQANCIGCLKCLKVCGFNAVLHLKN
ncbi:4Fe-4S dicluster domain-containing protein [Marinifilum sp. D737]|uniref:4Fe-4S dicluster domain-containing protein n=1 Tax=Marinifilum sp. D737 TaxID=2969628 RepID=UPI003FA353E2